MPLDDKFTRWIWEWSGRYDYWVVEKFISGDTKRVTYGDTLVFRTRKDAIAVSSALNSAYRAGVAFGTTPTGQKCLRCDVDIPGMAVILFVGGVPLTSTNKDSHVFCINCGSNGKNSISGGEYKALLENRGLA